MGSIKDSTRTKRAIKEHGLLSNQGGETTVTFPAFFNNTVKATSPIGNHKSPLNNLGKPKASTKRSTF